MPQELETDAFRRMNFLKYKADHLQKGGGEPAQIQALLAQAAELKNQILKSNLRVAVHVARKHHRLGIPLMELVSDATIWLMRALIPTILPGAPPRRRSPAPRWHMRSFPRMPASP